MAAASSRQTNTEARIDSLMLNHRATGAWSSTGEGRSQYPDFLHVMVGGDSTKVDLCADPEIKIWMGVTGHAQFQDLSWLLDLSGLRRDAE